MPWDATVEVMLPPRGAGDWQQEFVGSWRVGTVVAVYVPPKRPETIAMPRTGYVQVTGIPDRIAPERLRAVICEPWLNPDGTKKERRVWRAQVAAMLDPGKTVLLRDRQVEITWDRLKQLSQHMEELRPATDDDFSGSPASSGSVSPAASGA